MTGLGFGIYAFPLGTWGFLAGIVLWTLGEIGFSAASPAFIAHLAPVHARGVYQGALHMLWGAAAALAPLIGTSVLSAFSAAGLWVGCFVACLLAALAHLRLRTGPRG